MKREGVIRGGRGCAGQVSLLGDLDNSIHSASSSIEYGGASATLFSVKIYNTNTQLRTYAEMKMSMKNGISIEKMRGKANWSQLFIWLQFGNFFT